MQTQAQKEQPKLNPMEQLKNVDAQKVGLLLVAKKGLIIGAAAPLIATAVWNDVDVDHM